MANTVVVYVVICAAATSALANTKLHPARDEALKRIDVIFNNTRMRESYIRCFMGRGLCFKEAMELKNLLPDAMSTNCTKCSEIQKITIDRFFQFLSQKRPKLYNRIVLRYEPMGEMMKQNAQKPGKKSGKVRTTTTIPQDTVPTFATAAQDDSTSLP